MGVLERSCSHPSCTRMAGPGSLCEYHLMLWRRGMGLCPNCGGQRERVAVVNELTGRQLRRGPGRHLVWQMRCIDCGRQQRPYTEEEQA